MSAKDIEDAGADVAVTAAAWKTLFAAVPVAQRLALGLRADACGPALVLRCAAVQTPFFNRAIGVGADAADDLLDSLRARFAAQGIGRYFVQVPAGGARGRLEARGWAPYHRRWVLLGRGVEAPPEADTRLDVRAAGMADVETVARLFCDGFEMPHRLEPVFAAVVGPPRAPGWRAYVACDETGAAVAAAAMFIGDGAAYLGGAVTAPAHRGRHAQGALMSRRLADARAHGCSRVVTETGEAIEGQPSPSLHNMLRCGFTPRLLIENWGPEATTWLPPA